MCSEWGCISIFVSLYVLGSGCGCNDDSSSSYSMWSMVSNSTWSGYGYFPSFPATSPYVTAVGGTMGPNTGGDEVVCMSDAVPTGVITSGGGFSTYYEAKLPVHRREELS